MEIREPDWRSIFYAYASGVIGAYVGGVASLFLPDAAWIQTLGAGIGGVTMLLIVKMMHYKWGLVILASSIVLPLYPAYYQTFYDPHARGDVLATTRAVNLRPGPGLQYGPVLAVLTEGTEVTLLNRSWRRTHFERDSGSYYNYWRLVASDSGTGWIYGGYLAEPAN